MNALVIKHIDCEGPGVLGDIFASHGVDVTLAHPYRAEPLPPVTGHDFLVVLGGPMGVYERDHYVFIDAEAELVRERCPSTSQRSASVSAPRSSPTRSAAA